MKLGGVFPLWGLVMVVGAVLSLTVFCLTGNHNKPRFHAVSPSAASLKSSFSFKVWVNSQSSRLYLLELYKRNNHYPIILSCLHANMYEQWVSPVCHSVYVHVFPHVSMFTDWMQSLCLHRHYCCVQWTEDMSRFSSFRDNVTVGAKHQQRLIRSHWWYRVVTRRSPRFVSIIVGRPCCCVAGVCLLGFRCRCHLDLLRR